MIYTLKCDKCGVEELVKAPIQEGPPHDLPCGMCEDGTMYSQFGTNFILKGGGWPGKAIKQEREGQEARAAEMMQEGKIQRNNRKAISKEVLAERRKGRASWAEYQQKNPEKVKQYRENMTHGIKPN